MVNFIVRNSRTTIEGADKFALRMIDVELRYSTDLVAAKATGASVPYRPNDGPGGWDGWVRFLRRPKIELPWFPTGLLSRALRVCDEMVIPYECEDLRVRPAEGIPDFPKIDLRDYQQEAVAIAIKKGMGVLDMPPRSGKTRTMLEIVRCLGLPAIWMAPTTRICVQTRDVVESFFGKGYAYHLVGSGARQVNTATDHRLVLCTAATAAGLPLEFFETREVLVIDEYHHAAAKTYQGEVFPKCNHIYHRFGMTGTYFRSGNDVMALHAHMSDLIYKVSSQFLLDHGHLVPTEVVFLPVVAPKLRGLPSTTYQAGHGKFGIQEHLGRNRLVASVVILAAQAGKRVLVLVATKKQGYTLRKMILSYLRGNKPGTQFDVVEFVSTDMANYIQGKVIDAFLETDEVKVLLGTSILGEGVDLPTADVLVYAYGQKAEVTLTQNAYRISTPCEGKRSAVIIDFADRHHKKLLAHSTERLAVYYGEPTFTVRVLQDVAQFTPWLSVAFSR